MGVALGLGAWISTEVGNVVEHCGLETICHIWWQLGIKNLPWPLALHSESPLLYYAFFSPYQLLPSNILCNFIIVCLSWLECQLPEGKNLSVLFINVYQEPRIVPCTEQASNSHLLNKWMIYEWINIAASWGANVKLLEVKKGRWDKVVNNFKDSIEQTRRGNGQQRGSQGSQTVVSL